MHIALLRAVNVGVQVDFKLTTARLEGKLGTRGTGRNGNTVQKLAALTGA